MASALVKSRVVKRQSEGLCRIQRVPAFYVLSFVHAQNGEFNKNINRVVWNMDAFYRSRFLKGI